MEGMSMPIGLQLPKENNQNITQLNAQFESPSTGITRSRGNTPRRTSDLHQVIAEFVSDVVSTNADLTEEQLLAEATMRNIADNRGVQEFIKQRASQTRARQAAQVAIQVTSPTFRPVAMPPTQEALGEKPPQQMPEEPPSEQFDRAQFGPMKPPALSQLTMQEQKAPEAKSQFDVYNAVLDKTGDSQLANDAATQFGYRQTLELRSQNANISERRMALLEKYEPLKLRIRQSENSLAELRLMMQDYQNRDTARITLKKEDAALEREIQKLRLQANKLRVGEKDEWGGYIITPNIEQADAYDTAANELQRIDGEIDEMIGQRSVPTGQTGKFSQTSPTQMGMPKPTIGGGKESEILPSNAKKINRFTVITK
jgi:hypothetical protein